MTSKDRKLRHFRIAMLLDNPFRPDPRVAREAKVLADLGHQVTIYAWDRDAQKKYPEIEKSENYKIIRFPVKTQDQMGIRQLIRFLIFAWRAFKVIIREDIDVVHCHDFLNLLVCIPLKLLKRIPLVYDAHEIYWIMEATKYSKAILSILKYIEIFLLQFVDVFITVGESRVAYYRPFFKNNIHIVGNWYDPKSQDLNLRKSFRNKLGIPEKAFVVAYTGTLGHQRAPDVIVSCARQIQKSEMPIYWIIAGRGSEEDLFKKAASEGINLYFLDWVQDPAPIYASSDVLLYLMDENLPYSKYAAPNNLYLSISWSLPLITIKAGEMNEILGTNEAGILLDKANVNSLFEAVCKLYRDSDLYQKFLKKLLGLQSKYSWQSSSKELLKAYRSIK